MILLRYNNPQIHPESFNFRQISCMCMILTLSKADIFPFCFSLRWSGALGDPPVAFRLAKAQGANHYIRMGPLV